MLRTNTLDAAVAIKYKNLRVDDCCEMVKYVKFLLKMGEVVIDRAAVLVDESHTDGKHQPWNNPRHIDDANMSNISNLLGCCQFLVCNAVEGLTLRECAIEFRLPEIMREPEILEFFNFLIDFKDETVCKAFRRKSDHGKWSLCLLLFNMDWIAKYIAHLAMRDHSRKQGVSLAFSSVSTFKDNLNR